MDELSTFLNSLDSKSVNCNDEEGPTSSSSHSYYARVIMVDAEIGTPKWLCERNQPFPFVMGPETVMQLVGKTSMDILDFIGYEHSYVKENIEMGKQFFIVFFKGYQTPVKSGTDDDGASFLDENHHKTSVEATWSNILELIQDHSPICGAKFASVFDQVCTMAYDDYDFDVENCPFEIYQAETVIAVMSKAVEVQKNTSFLEYDWIN